MRSLRVFLFVAATLLVSSALGAQSERRALFGDLHIHTSFSFDAFIFGTLTTPDDAYRFARGEAIDHPAGYKLQLDRPLDFYAVTDHASTLGMLRAMSNPNHPLSKLEGRELVTEARTIPEKIRAFRTGGGLVNANLDLEVVKSAWAETIAAAERHNKPGMLTTFIAYEFTSGRGGNLHRNVIFNGSQAPDRPFSRADSLNPEDLWDWMDAQRAQGMELLAIPHNANGSNGQMFDLETFDGDPLTRAWAEQRIRNETLVEITQVKGTSATHPFLSPNDEWADFEIFPYQIASYARSNPSGSYVREALINGLRLEQQLGVNPYRVGIIGASDTHNGGGSFDESNFTSKVGLLDGIAQNRGSVPFSWDARGEQPAYKETYYRYWGASGLTGVWAEENTRESIFDAFRRQETFATSGPRMQVRFFAGYDVPADLDLGSDWVGPAYENGVAMGSDLEAQRRGEPRFVAWAVKDPTGASLQRLQIIKGWQEDGGNSEMVYDVACSDGGNPDRTTHRCPDNGAAVDITDCSITSGVGDSELSAVWSDPDFDASQRAVYYVRVLENPTCRWSTWDAIKAGVDPRPDLATTLQERAWSSPIWIRPRS